MRRAGRAALLVAGASLVTFAGLRTARADDTKPEDHVFLEVQVSKASIYVGEPFLLRIRVGIDEPWFAAHAVPLFRRPTDLPLHVTAPWLPVPKSTRAMREVPESGAPRLPRSSLALGDDAVVASLQASEDDRGRSFQVWQVERRLLPEVAGDLVLEGATLRFASATKFEEDALGTRRPTDRRDVSVPGPVVRVHVSALPEEGRPAGFSGLVGAYEASASVDKARATVGETLRVTWRIDGEGNLETMGTPRLEGARGGLPGFHVFGTLDDKGSPRRTIVIEASPLSTEVHAVPPLSLAYFDPGPPAQYRTAKTAEIPLEVTGGAGAGSPPSPARERPASDEATPGSTRFWLLLALAVLGLGAFLLRRRSSTRASTAGPANVAGPAQAREAYRAALSAREAAGTLRPDPIASHVEALTAYLGVLLHCPPSAVATTDLSVRLAAAGVPLDLASRVASTLTGWIASRYGGEVPSGPTAEALVGELEASAASRSGEPPLSPPR